MILIRFILALLTVTISISAIAQEQPGFVKTLGRPNQKGQPLSGVSIRVKGAHNAVLNKSDGTFGMQIQDNSFVLQYIQKSGYELNEKEIIGRKYAFSSHVPFTIIMVSIKQLQADKLRIENNAYAVAEKNYKSIITLLEEQRTLNKVTIEQYRQKIQELEDKYDKFQTLINDLADHYAHTDYDNLDEKEREINLCIENGDLDKAESLLHEIGIHNKIEEINRNLENAQKLKDQADKDLVAILKQQEKDAEHLYMLYTIALARFDFDHAAEYIVTRAELDTTNYEWVSDAAEFYQKQNNFTKSELYYMKALRLGEQLSKENDINNLLYSITLHNLGALYKDTKRMKDSELMNKKALAVRVKLAENYSIEKDVSMAQFLNSYVAASWNNLAVLYRDTKQFEEGIKCGNLAVNLYRSLSEKDQKYEADLSGALIHLANLHYDIKQLTEAEELYKESVMIFSNLNTIVPHIYDEELALVLSNLATLCDDIQQYSESEKYHFEAFDILTYLVENNRKAYEPKLALAVHNLASHFYKTKQYNKSKKMFDLALEMRIKLSKENYQVYGYDLAETLNNYGLLYDTWEKYL